MHASHTASPAPPVTILELSGDLIAGTGTAAVRARVKELAAQGHHNLVFNLRDVTDFDSAAADILAEAQQCMTDLGGDLKLLHLPKQLNDLLVITRLQLFFEIYDDEAMAIDSFQHGPLYEDAWFTAGRAVA